MESIFGYVAATIGFMLSTYLKISRPRFWLYLLGPFLIGAVAAGQAPRSWADLIVFGLYFTFPANLLLYGVNDLFDYETDRRNPKKRHYEMLVKPALQRRLIVSMWLWNVPLLTIWLVSGIPLPARLALLGFVFFGIFYSAPPIRAKTKPLLDSIFNILYVFPGLVGYALITREYPPVQVVAAAGIWCMAMHAYSAVPDIHADRKAGIRTIATWLGARGTLLFCLIGFLLAAALSLPWLGAFSVLAGLLYAAIVLDSLANPHRNHVFKIYRRFPIVNMAVGMALFFWVAFIVK
jgi:4-hydroxybenzoate polyprenyltransferase